MRGDTNVIVGHYGHIALTWLAVVSTGRGQMLDMSSGAYSPLRVDY
jgi:hypothetical protein